MLVSEVVTKHWMVGYREVWDGEIVRWWNVEMVGSVKL